jgi:hypothetical protein
MATMSRGSLGVSPTKQQKLSYIASSLGLSGLTSMQGSTVNIFDTVVLNTNATRQTLTFFNGTQNKSRNFSNFQSGVLNAGEALIIEEVSIFAVNLTGSDLTQDSTAVISITPVAGDSNTGYPNKGGFVTGLMNLTIANSKVVKDLNTYEMDPAFNPRTTGIASFDTSIATNTRMGEAKLYMEAPPVLPPNQKLTLTLEFGPTGTIPANTGIMVVLGRFGCIFSAKTNL